MSSCRWPSAAWTARLWVWPVGRGTWPRDRTSAASPPALFPWSPWLRWSARSCRCSIQLWTPFCCPSVWRVRLLPALLTRRGPGLHTAPAEGGGQWGWEREGWQPHGLNTGSGSTCSRTWVLHECKAFILLQFDMFWVEKQTCQEILWIGGIISLFWPSKCHNKNKQTCN